MRTNELLNNFEKYNFLTIEDIAENLDISLRTAQNELNLLRDIASGYTIEYSDLLGYFLNINDPVKYAELRKKYKQIIELNYDDRKKVILGTLLLNFDYITVFELCKKVQVSDSQVRKILKEISNTLLQYRLVMVCKAHYGFKINGDFSDRMHVLVNLLHSSDKCIQAILGFLFTPKQYDDIRVKLVSISTTYKWSIDDHQAKTIIDWLIILKQMQKNINDNHKLKKERLLYQIIGAYYDLSNVPKDAFIWFEDALSVLLKCSLNNLSYQDVCCLINNFLTTKITENLRIIRNDKEFIRLLSLHTVFMLDRLYKNIHVWNPYAKNLSQTCPIAFTQAVLLAKEIENKYHLKVNVEEIGLLAMHIANAIEQANRCRNEQVYHIGVVCPLGGGVSEWIRRQLCHIFERAKIKNFALAQMDELKKFKPDLIFSITTLTVNFKCPIIKLDDENINFFRKNEVNNYLEQITFFAQTTDFWHLFYKESFQVIDECTDYNSLLEQRALVMEQLQKQKGYAKSLMEREKYLSTIYQNGIAIPHPLEMHGQHNRIDVSILPKGIKGGSTSPIIIFMIGLKANDLYMHQLISKYLVRLSQNKYSVEKLVKVKNFKEFIHVLKLSLQD